VSPTHIRVTAGGRIVPNTRVTIPPPLLEWTANNSYIEPRHALVNFEGKPLHPSPWTQNTAFPCSTPGSFLPSYKLMPAAMGSPVALSHLANGGILQEPVRAAMKSEQTASAQKLEVLPHPIKISPPSQFDISKPFYINGQLLYPVTSGFKPPAANIIPAPLTMTGNPSTAYQTSVQLVPSQYLPPQLTSLSSHLPAMSALIPTTDYLKTEIQGLRANIQHIEQQLTDNNYQVDKNEMNRQRSALLLQVGTMESVLETQINKGAEPSNHLAGDNTVDSSGLALNLYKENLETDPTFNNVTLSDYEGYPSLQAKKAEQKFSASCGVKSILKPENSGKSRLPLTAAKAPPFQPRALSATATSFSSFLGAPTKSQAKSQTGVNGLNPNSVARARIVHEGVANRSNFINPQSFNPAHGVVHPEQSNFQRGAFDPHESSAMLQVVPTDISSQTNPYLIGTLPHGTNINTATYDDYLYGRPLTEEEVRARYLYFGKAPRSVQSGLPKFDGKDFYPPSPIKHFARPAPAMIGSQTAPLPQLPAFENLFTERGVPGYKTPPVSRVAQFSQRLVPIEPPVFGVIDQHIIRPRSNSLDQRDHTPSTPSSHKQPIVATTPLAFANLFMEHRVPGYKSPTLAQVDIQNAQRIHENQNESLSITSDNIVPPVGDGRDFYRVQPVNVWGSETHRPNTVSDIILTDSDEGSNSSMVEINLSPKTKIGPTALLVESSFAERISNTRTQVFFAQNCSHFLADLPLVPTSNPLSYWRC
jgi:hypothetical protein